jgi:hypothetical protein
MNGQPPAILVTLGSARGNSAAALRDGVSIKELTTVIDAVAHAFVAYVLALPVLCSPSPGREHEPAVPQQS